MEKHFLTVAETGSASLKPILPSSLVTESLDSWEQTLVQVRMGWSGKGGGFQSWLSLGVHTFGSASLSLFSCLKCACWGSRSSCLEL